jgi:hypothetical protein
MTRTEDLAFPVFVPLELSIWLNDKLEFQSRDQNCPRTFRLSGNAGVVLQARCNGVRRQTRPRYHGVRLTRSPVVEEEHGRHR